MVPGRVAIVGNGPVAAGAAAAIDRCDHVIRFNRPAHGNGEAGRRTDLLFFMNSGKDAQALLSDADYLTSPAVAECRRVVLPYHPAVIARHHPRPNILSRLKGRRADWTQRAIEVFGAAGKDVTILSPQFYERCCEELGIAPEQRRRLFPSTGFLGIVYALAEFPPPRYDIELHGFGWQGWKRHDWAREKEWVERSGLHSIDAARQGRAE